VPDLATARPHAGTILLAGLIAALSLWLAWSCLAGAVAGYYRRLDPPLALRWAPADADLLARVADLDLGSAKSKGDVARAQALAERALRRGPLEVRALRVLGLTADKAGRAGQAARLMRIAGARSLRDSDTQLWLFYDAARRGDDAEAFARADALLRLDADNGPALFPVMIRRLTDPRAVAPLGRHLASHPDWRPAFLAQLTARPTDVGVAERVFDVLHRGPAPPEAEEIASLIARLTADHQYAAARSTWARLLPGHAPGGAPTPVYDGDFQGLPGGPPFNWSLVDTGDGRSELATAPGGDRALHTQFDSGKGVDLAQEMLVLPPGRYRLSGQVFLAAAGPPDTLVWRLDCAETGATVLVEARSGGPGGAWRPFSASFTVPQAGCALQRLQLSSTAEDYFGATDAWFRSLSVDREAAAG
jgi:hypothetical protein